MPESVKMFAVHRLGGNGRGKPECFVTLQDAVDMVNVGVAEWSKSFKYLTRTKLSAEMYRAAASLKPNVRTMDKFVEGDAHAVAIVEAYRPTFSWAA